MRKVVGSRLICQVKMWYLLLNVMWLICIDCVINKQPPHENEGGKSRRKYVHVKKLILKNAGKNIYIIYRQTSVDVARCVYRRQPTTYRRPQTTYRRPYEQKSIRHRLDVYFPCGQTEYRSNRRLIDIQKVYIQTSTRSSTQTSTRRNLRRPLDVYFPSGLREPVRYGIIYAARNPLTKQTPLGRDPASHRGSRNTIRDPVTRYGMKVVGLWYQNMSYPDENSPRCQLAYIT